MRQQIKLLIGILIITFLGCSKDTELLLETSSEYVDEQITTRAYDEEECGYISELCIKCKYDKAPDDPVLARSTTTIPRGGTGGTREEIDDNFIRVILASDTFTIRPTNYFDTSDEYLITTTTDEYIITNSSDAFVQSFDTGFRLPVEIDAIGQVSNSNLAEGTLDIQYVESSFGAGAVVTDLGQGNYQVYIDQPEGGTGNARIIDPCSGITMAVLTKRYVQILGANNFHSNAEQIISHALNDCIPPNFDLTSDCIDSKCVVDNAIANGSTGTSADHTIKLNYLKHLLDLTDDEYNQLASISSANINFINRLYDDLDEDRDFLPCNNADCSLPVAYQSLIGIYLYSDITLDEDDIENAKTFFEQMSCDKGLSYVNQYVDEIGPCGMQFISLYLREDLPTSDLYLLLEKYEEAYRVYYGGSVYQQPLGDELLAEGVTWCDMIEITNVMYENAIGLPALTNGDGTTMSLNGGSTSAGPVLLLFKGLGEGFGDALAQAFFLWIADNDINDFSTAIENIDPFEVTLAFFKGLIPWKSTTNTVAAHLVADAGIAAIVVMDRAIEQDNYSWSEAGNDFASVFVNYITADIFGATFVKYGSVLVKGVIKKFDFAPNGFFGGKIKYSRIAKIMGGGLDNNPPYGTHIYNDPDFGEQVISPTRMMKEWELTDEVFIIGRGQSSRIEPYKYFLQDMGINAKTICDVPGWDCSSTILDNQATFDLNRLIIRNKKLDGVRFLDLGDAGIPNTTTFNYYQMEVDEIFN